MPPEAASVAVKAAFCVPLGKEVVVIEGVAPTVRLSALVAASEWASVTCTVKLAVPVAVGVPVILPDLGARVSPAGKLPEMIDQV